MMNRRSGFKSPVECRPFTNIPSAEMRSSAARPMRVISFMFRTTYALSVISTPQREKGESMGPMQ